MIAGFLNLIIAIAAVGIVLTVIFTLVGPALKRLKDEEAMAKKAAEQRERDAIVEGSLREKAEAELVQDVGVIEAALGEVPRSDGSGLPPQNPS
jgi:flagellar biosynthesis/type III secretory pathway M-ring protein FliF/YscJ